MVHLDIKYFLYKSKTTFFVLNYIIMTTSGTVQHKASSFVYFKTFSKKNVFFNADINIFKNIIYYNI